MNPENLSRKEKENFFKLKTIELKRTWEDKTVDDFTNIDTLSDIELDNKIELTLGLLRSEKIANTYTNFLKIIFFILIVFVILGIIGLLIFGIKQLY